MRRERPGWFRDLTFAFSAAFVLAAAAELAVRLAGVEPGEIPSPGGAPTPPGIRVDPLFGARPRPGWSGGWSMAGFPVVIDDRGFRSAEGVRPSAGETRIAFLGDSCTFGWGLDWEGTFVAGVEEMARRSGRSIDFINAAYPGDSAVSGSYVLRERVLPLEPDVVVLGYSGNNAFRFSRVSDAERFRFFALRKLLLHSRLIQIANARMARRSSEKPHPRDKEGLRSIPLASRRRVANPAEFEEAVRSMVRLVRSRESRAVFLLFPRASQVSEHFGGEDAVVAYHLAPLPPRSAAGEVSDIDSHMLQYSCLDHQSFDDPVETVRSRVRDWRPVYPKDNGRLRRKLSLGARAYAEGHLVEAARVFRAAVRIDPDSPLALYDLGATSLDLGETAEGLRLLARADRLACNVFLQYQVIVRRVAAELRVPVVDLVLHFQAHDAASLFRDPAHPSVEARDVIAGVLWPVLARSDTALSRK
jgi:lysophospholipase L1-like esterase